MSKTNIDERIATYDECKERFDDCWQDRAKCLMCRYFDPYGKAIAVVANNDGGEEALYVSMPGRCRISPPVADMTIRADGCVDAEGIWPEVTYLDWCGKFERDDARGVEFMTGG